MQLVPFTLFVLVVAVINEKMNGSPKQSVQEDPTEQEPDEATEAEGPAGEDALLASSADAFSLFFRLQNRLLGFFKDDECDWQNAEVGPDNQPTLILDASEIRHDRIDESGDTENTIDIQSDTGNHIQSDDTQEIGLQPFSDRTE